MAERRRSLNSRLCYVFNSYKCPYYMDTEAISSKTWAKPAQTGATASPGMPSRWADTYCWRYSSKGKVSVASICFCA